MARMMTRPLPPCQRRGGAKACRYAKKTRRGALAASGRDRELSEQCGNEFGHRWMDVHGALQHGVWRLRVHGVEHAVDGFVASGPKHSRPQNLLRSSVHDDLHEPLGFALFNRTAHTGHRPLPDKDRVPATARLLLRDTGAAERRIDI